MITVLVILCVVAILVMIGLVTNILPMWTEFILFLQTDFLNLFLGLPAVFAIVPLVMAILTVVAILVSLVRDVF